MHGRLREHGVRRRREDGRVEYRTRKGQVLVFTAEALMKRLLAVMPPRGVHLTRFHGAFAPNAALRSRVVRPVPSSPETGGQVGSTVGAGAWWSGRRRALGGRDWTGRRCSGGPSTQT
ncbi:transposase [Myxococcus sp. SDU36]|uniref:transposase n=1 Tax=Myxococcus sp. SDU36 TaxID=2831967 RepID=UPI0032EC1E0C